MPSKYTFTDLVKHCLAEVIVETPEINPAILPTRKNAQFESLVKKCTLEVLKENLTIPLKEALTPKAIAVIQKWQQQLGDNRRVAVKLVDYALSRKIGLTSSDLADTTTFSGGLDMIEQSLADGNFQSAFDVAKDTADEMITDEGGAGMDEGFDPLSQGPNPDCKENPYPEWNAHMRSLEEDLGEDAGKWLRRLVVAGLLSWASLTSDGRDAVKTAFHALQIKSPERVAPAVAKQIEDDLPMKGSEIDNFIESQYDRIDQVKKHYGPAADAIFKLDFLFRPEKGGTNENEHGRYAQEAGAGQFDPNTFGVNEYVCTPCTSGNHQFCNRRDFRNRCCCQQS